MKAPPTPLRVNPQGATPAVWQSQPGGVSGLAHFRRLPNAAVAWEMEKL